MKRYIFIILSFALLSSCGKNNEINNRSDGKNSSSQTEYPEELNVNSSNRLMENPKNIAGNGVIFIEDSADYPDYMIYTYHIRMFQVACGDIATWTEKF